ncbi:MAG: hypothetical protein A3I77_06025 [Gammaproteobacteria bacterium RIFCSPLOWO2_02_FULL_42_14]|nr:MAG: hypothetical protein A3B71_06615 [Gammaproteobacteria bacterium RIFCSPHIGHO2_02_FULL_42_43]OGT27884.1 MAG: hypothetical protein A2624_02505 [Gammaproteobacteria bacterium RIFCSPHIGHO2_01_FULL_42_8]OGT52554.1 MAG: hypothetical protein A3E54_06220 [Gammaproteobacteria bacterium RIFCSPHIGHO2_12_FULL_41_25]OGT63152.1 MAG: hypothetical protein A3I77_06025 [Gammaproteobacteria bacterium RIFCSPLOWO2_02_FULL_42_14]OGT86652.1 MAG: hypothetical protein A3G86_04845 [Gammaproteobacteria bacterium R
MKKSHIITFCAIAMTTAMLPAHADFTPAFTVNGGSYNDGQPWAVSLGAGYGLLYGDSVSGDVATSDLSATTHYYIASDNIRFRNGWISSLAIMRSVIRHVSIGLGYAYFATGISPGTAVYSAVATAYGGYEGDLGVHTLLAQAKFTWNPIFITLGVGGAYVKAYDQQPSNTSGTLISMRDHGVYNLAYAGAAGLIYHINSAWTLDSGVQYTYYGSFNSGTIAGDHGSTLKSAVTAKLYSIAPFINATYHFA